MVISHNNHKNSLLKTSLNQGRFKRFYIKLHISSIKYKWMDDMYTQMCNTRYGTQCIYKMTNHNLDFRIIKTPLLLSE